MVFLFCRRPCVSGAESSDAESAASNFSAAANVASCLNWNPPPRQSARGGGPIVSPPKDKNSKAQSEEDTCLTVTERSIDQEHSDQQEHQEELSRDSHELKQEAKPKEDVWQKLQTSSTTSLSLQTTPNTMEISADSSTVYDDDTTAVADNRGGLLSGPLSSSDLNSMTSWLSSHVEEDLDYYEESDESSAGNWEPILEEDEEDLSSARGSSVHSHISGDDHDVELGLDLGLESDADESSVGIAMETAILPLMQQRSRSFPPSDGGSTDKTKSKTRFSKILLFNLLITLLMATGILDLDYLLARIVFRSSSPSQQDSQLRLGNFLLRRQSHVNTTFSMFEAPRRRPQSRNNHHAPAGGRPTARTRATVQTDDATTFVPTAERKEYPNMPMSPANFMSDLVEEDTEYMPTDKFEGLIRSDSFLFGIQQNNKGGEKTQPPPPPPPVDDTNWTLKLLNLRLHVVQQQPRDEQEPIRRFRCEQPQRPPVVVTVWKVLVEAYQRLDIHVRGQSQMAQFKQHHWNLKVAKALSTFDVM